MTQWNIDLYIEMISLHEKKKSEVTLMGFGILQYIFKSLS